MIKIGATLINEDHITHVKSIPKQLDMDGVVSSKASIDVFLSDGNAVNFEGTLRLITHRLKRAKKGA